MPRYAKFESTSFFCPLWTRLMARAAAVIVGYYSFVAFPPPTTPAAGRLPGSSAVTARRSMHVMLSHSPPHTRIATYAN